MNKITSHQAYYIKLGAGGEWEHECIESASPTIWVGFNSIPHELCVEKKWNRVGKIFAKEHGWQAGMVTTKVNQLRTFYEAPVDTLWVTFYKDRLWWCFAGSEISILQHGSRTRPALDGWKSTDIYNHPLETSRLSGSLLSMQGYRGTLCRVRELDYLINKINGEESPEMIALQQTLDELQRNLEKIIQHLHWKDFELLVDLIFRQAGWQRVSQLGKTQKTLDLDLYAPVTNERLLVQVKSRGDKNTFNEFIAHTSGLEDYVCYYLIVHSPAANLMEVQETDIHKLWLLKDIARLVIQYGLADWVVGKAR